MLDGTIDKGFHLTSLNRVVLQELQAYCSAP